MANALEDVVALIIDVNPIDDDNDNPSEYLFSRLVNVDDNDNPPEYLFSRMVNVYDNDNPPKYLFSRMVTVDDNDECTAFTTALQEIIKIHALNANLPPHLYDDSFYGVMIEAGCAHGSSIDYAKYMAYWKGTG